jgi:hypothetical protein
VHAAATVAAAIAVAPIRARRLPRFTAPMQFTPFYKAIILVAASSSFEDIASRSGVASRR